MKWALVNQRGQCSPLKRDGRETQDESILRDLPEPAHEEFLRQLRLACESGELQQMSVPGEDEQSLSIDIVPVRQGESASAMVSIDRRLPECTSCMDGASKLARRNEAILRSAMDGFFVVDAQCRFLEVNDAFCRMMGYTHDELMRMRISDLEVDEAENGGVPSHTRTGLHHFPTAHRHKDGHLVHLEISINVLRDNGQKILVGFARDETERLRAERELSRLTHEQKLILDSAAEGIAGIDRDGRITFINAAGAGTLDGRPGEFIGRQVHEALFGTDGTADAHQQPGPVQTVLANDTGLLRLCGYFQRTNGERFPAEYSLTPMLQGLSVIGAVIVFKDLSEHCRLLEERRNLEAQMLQSQKLESLGLLAGGIAHDLNNMLAGIQGNAILANESLDDSEAVDCRLTRIVAVCQRASKVVRQILTYAGRVACETGPLQLNDFVLEMKEFMRAIVSATIRLETRLETDLPTTEADAGQMQQVITSLIINAAEAIGETTGLIILSTQRRDLTQAEIIRSYAGQELRPGRYVCLAIEDDGCGMPAEMLDRIFEPFYSSKGSGRGLGLSAVRGIALAHKGGLRVESTVGHGTRVEILLPVHKTPQAGGPGTLAQPKLRAGTTLLVVDDDDEVRDVIKDMLTACGMNVLTAENGTRGIELFQEHADEIDAVLLDMMMPDMSGAEVFPKLLEIRPDAAVIIASGYSEESIASRFERQRPAGFVFKPFTPSALLDRIGSVIASRAAAAEQL